MSEDVEVIGNTRKIQKKLNYWKVSYTANIFILSFYKDTSNYSWADENIVTSISANSLLELRKALDKVLDRVPPRGLGRRKEHTEPWIMKRLVMSLASAGVVKFPLRVELNDRPDIVLESDGRTIGIELMELVPPAYAKAVAIANREFPSAIVDRSVFGWGTTWTPEGIREYLKNKGHRLSGDGWVGDAVETEWADAVRCAIEKKTERLNTDGFRTFSENWLGTYDSAPGPLFNAEVGAKLLTPSDLIRPKFTRNFDLAVNLVSDSLIVLSKTGVNTCLHTRS